MYELEPLEDSRTGEKEPLLLIIGIPVAIFLGFLIVAGITSNL